MRFPTLTTKDLNGNRRHLPDDFKGDINLLLIAYLRQHQDDVDTWVPRLEELEAQHPSFRYYELPVVAPLSRLGRMSLDFGMRAGIPDPDTRERTLTLYVDRAEFRRSLDIPTEDTIALVLLDHDHQVTWQGLGPWQEATAADLDTALGSLTAA